MVPTMLYNIIFALHEEGNRPFVRSHFWEMMEKHKSIFVSPKKFLSHTDIPRIT